jgi:hypothetical protein
MSVKFFINNQVIAKLGAAAVGYATADRLGLNRAAVATVLIFSATIGNWSSQLIRDIALSKYPNAQRNKDQPKVENQRNLFYFPLNSVSYLLLTKTTQIAAGKFGVPLSFVQCVGVTNLYFTVVALPLVAIIGSLFPSTSIYK